VTASAASKLNGPPVTHPLLELGIHRIECPIPIPQAGGPANVYLIEERDGGVALFDSGIGTPVGEAAVREGFRALGYKFGDVRRIYLSHGHIDHYGLAQTISEESGAPVYIHEADRLKVEHPGADWQASREAYRDYMLRLGASAEEIQRLERDHLNIMKLARPIERTRSVRDGEVLQFRRFAATVQHSPGHTPGLTCLYIENAGILFSDDHLLERVSPNPLIEIGPEGPDLKFRALSTYLRTLEKTRTLPIKLVLPGHAKPFHEPNRVIDTLLGFYAKRQEKMLDKIAQGPATAIDIVMHVFPRVGRRELNLTMSEIVGNLEVLEERGAIRRLSSEHVYRWELASGT
jgi:glyoxylase-like metal-dependent hydrolase (beta-lactamase superfamily II)